MSGWDRFRREVWLKRNLLRFLRCPVERRACVNITRDGRFLTALLAALHEMNFGVHAINSPALFRELEKLRHAAPLPFVVGGAPRPCGLVISDQPSEAFPGQSRRIQIEYDFFRPDRAEARMPYFMHPASYHLGLYRESIKGDTVERSLRILFLGAYQPGAYARDFHFPILNRMEILGHLLARHPEACHERIPPDLLECPRPLCFVLDPHGGDSAQSYLPTRPVYFDLLQRAEFFLCPPGVTMPQAHNLVEAMSRGCIPITNYGRYLNPPLQPGENCMAFETLDDLDHALTECQTMDAAQINKLRAGALAYYEAHLNEKWLSRLLRDTTGDLTLLVNNEEQSLALKGGIGYAAP